MTDKTLVIVHGMGEETGDSFKKKVVDALSYGLGLYPSWENKKIEQSIDVVPFAYNSFFSNYRDGMANAAKPLADRLSQLQLDGYAAQVDDIAQLDADIAKDNFFRTHFLDVLFYQYTTLAEPIRLALGDLICDHIDQKGSNNVHILGSSLGTSVVHDTLASMYAPPGQSRSNRNLSPQSVKLGSVHMVANVSRLLESFAKVDRSVVNPIDGCTFKYHQYRHVVDPFTIPKPFEPVDNGVWRDEDDISSIRYKEIRPKLVTQLNVHSTEHYLENPVCHVPLLQSLGINFNPSDEEFESAYAKHKEKSLQGVAGDLQQRWEAINLNDVNSVKAFVKAAKALRDMLAEFGEVFNS